MNSHITEDLASRGVPLTKIPEWALIIPRCSRSLSLEQGLGICYVLAASIQGRSWNKASSQSGSGSSGEKVMKSSKDPTTPNSEMENALSLHHGAVFIWIRHRCQTRITQVTTAGGEFLGWISEVSGTTKHRNGEIFQIAPIQVDTGLPNSRYHVEVI